MLDAVNTTNDHQKLILSEKITQHFAGQLKGRKIAIWGLAFKPRTDDIREASSLVLIDTLLAAGCSVSVHDPAALDNVRKLYGSKLTYTTNPLETVDGADALAIVTEWGDYRNPDWDELRTKLKQPVIFDGRNLLYMIDVRRNGFTYYCIGKG